MPKIYKSFAILLLSLIAGNTFSQGFVYKAGFFGFFDNREYFNEFVNDQTIFGSRISGELGYTFNQNNRIMAGINHLYEFGSNEWIAPEYTAYYYGTSNKASIYLGSFPRVNTIRMPLALLTDTFNYYRPNTQGIYVEFHNKAFVQNIWMDWTGRQSFDRKESFLIGMSGFYRKGIFAYQHHLVLTHLAHTSNTMIDEHIRDNGGYAVLPGINLTDRFKLDSIAIFAGVLGSVDRLRGIYDFSFPVGFMGEAVVEYKNVGMHGLVYAGDNQVITSGDGLYKSEFYSRIDAYYQKNNNQINGKVQVSMHMLPGVVDISMSLVIRATINGSFRNKSEPVN